MLPKWVVWNLNDFPHSHSSLHCHFWLHEFKISNKARCYYKPVNICIYAITGSCSCCVKGFEISMQERAVDTEGISLPNTFCGWKPATSSISHFSPCQTTWSKQFTNVASQNMRNISSWTPDRSRSSQECSNFCPISSLFFSTRGEKYCRSIPLQTTGSCDANSASVGTQAINIYWH